MTVDLDRLSSWMDEQGLPPGPIADVRALGGGTQNIMLSFRRGGADYVLRHPPAHKRKNSDETMRREARILGALKATAVPHPQLIAACGDVDVLGAAFYLTELVRGANPNVELPAPYVADPSWRWALGLAMADGAAAIAAVDYAAAGLGDLGRAEGFLERQVDRWRSQLESYTALPGYSGSAIPRVDAVAAWLEKNRPPQWRPGLMHGDYHLSNVLCALDRPGLAAIIDWELATIGDPLLDLGWLLASWPGPEGEHPRSVGAVPWEGFPTVGDLITRYAERSDRELSALPWYEVLACYKIGIILEGTYARSQAGQADREVGDRLHGITLDLFGRAGEIIATL